MKPITVKAYGKLNLFLHILRKRPDHYHDLFSLFHKVCLADELTFRKVIPTVCRITSNSKLIPTDKSNLISKAFWLLKSCTGFEGGIDVRVKKNIPVGAGMGGGSSDCAATLKAVNRIFKLGLSDEKLMHLGASLGADVPFFLQPAKSALVSGIGERIKPYARVGPFYFLLILFPRTLSTAKVYQALSLTPQKGGVRIPHFFANLRALETLKRYLRNDLMVASFQLYPSIRKVHKNLQQNGYVVSQTGSGPTLFVAGLKKASLVALARKVTRFFNVTTQLTQSV